MTARDLLAAATPRPWRDSGKSGAVVSDQLGPRQPLNEATIAFYGGIIVGESIHQADRALIVAAVNEYDLHLTAEEVLAEIAVDVVLADDLSLEAQVAALATVIRHHSEIASNALADLAASRSGT